MVDELMENFRKLGARMSVKMHFLHSHLDYFPENCGDLNEEQGELFHQDLHGMEEVFDRLLFVSEDGYAVCSAQAEISKRQFIHQ